MNCCFRSGASTGGALRAHSDRCSSSMVFGNSMTLSVRVPYTPGLNVNVGYVASVVTGYGFAPGSIPSMSRVLRYVWSHHVAELSTGNPPQTTAHKYEIPLWKSRWSRTLMLETQGGTRNGPREEGGNLYHVLRQQDPMYTLVYRALVSFGLVTTVLLVLESRYLTTVSCRDLPWEA